MLFLFTNKVTNVSRAKLKREKIKKVIFRNEKKKKKRKLRKLIKHLFELFFVLCSSRKKQKNEARAGGIDTSS